MKLAFTGTLEELIDKLSGLPGEWDESQPNKKVFRLNGGVMNWFPTTGTIQFQGKEASKTNLEDHVKTLLYPQEFPEPTETFEATPIPEYEVTENCRDQSNEEQLFLEGNFHHSEIAIGIVAAVGTETSRIINPLRDKLVRFGYSVEEIKVSSLLPSSTPNNEYERIKALMAAGDRLREKSKNNAALAYGAAKLISEKRNKDNPKRAYIVNSLKHPDEVDILRKIYGPGFYLFGVHADAKRRLKYLKDDKGLTQTQAIELTGIDEDEKIEHGQRTRDTYHLADFFINFGKNDDQVKNTIQRFLELIFAHPYKNPTFDEFAMFMAFCSSGRSGDLSRQVGAVIARNMQILSTGANESPASGGGLYWAKLDHNTDCVIDSADGKDYMRSEDSNKVEQTEIINGILKEVGKLNDVNVDALDGIRLVLQSSRIKDLTEFGRVVHAEMEALLSCSRGGISCVDATLYCTTFPCHNCAKHIIAAGIKRVVYVEPYPKSKALDFHTDSIELITQPGENNGSGNVGFEPFTGVGARRFLDFFSMNLGAGSKLKRKNKDGATLEWDHNDAKLRVSLLPKSYLDVERSAAERFHQMSVIE